VTWGNLLGGSGSDTLVAANETNNWQITGGDSGTLNGQPFSSIENLTGNAGADSFVVGAGGNITGTVNGAAGTDTLNLSAKPGALTVTIGVSALNVENFVGNGSSTLVGPNVGSTYAFTGASSGTISGGFSFSGFNTLRTGTGSDTFNAGVAYSGTVQIQGDDTWNYSSGVPLGSTITGATGSSLTIPGTAGATIDVAASDLSLPGLTGFQGNLIIGGTISPTTLPLNGSTKTTVNANKITVDSPITTGGGLVLLASDINLNADVSAGTGGNASPLYLVATGVATNNLTGTGNITANSAVTLSGGSAELLAANTIVNPGQITINLNGGNLQVAIASGNTEPTFNPASSANGIDLDAATQAFISALGLNLQGVVVSFSNPGAALAALEKLKVIDTGLFEQDLTLFGVIGNGIALDISQCEDLDGCAPSVTDDQLKVLISGLETKIADLKKLKAEGKASADADKQLANYQAQLDSFKSYKTELDEYQKEQQESEEVPSDLEDLGPNLGPDEGAPAPAGAAPAAPAEQPAAPEELEETPAPAEKAPAAAPAPLPEPPAKLEEQEQPEPPAAPAAPAAPAPAAPAAPAPQAKPAAPPPLPELPKSLDAPLEEEEIIEPQASVLPPVLPAAVSSYQWFASAYGTRPAWVGDLVMPSRHRVY
jgi:hypothetical protein